MENYASILGKIVTIISCECNNQWLVNFPSNPADSLITRVYYKMFGGLQLETGTRGRDLGMAYCGVSRVATVREESEDSVDVSVADTSSFSYIA